jgi:hypothetical protein
LLRNQAVATGSVCDDCRDFADPIKVHQSQGAFENGTALDAPFLNLSEFHRLRQAYVDSVPLNFKLIFKMPFSPQGLNFPFFPSEIAFRSQRAFP